MRWPCAANQGNSWIAMKRLKLRIAYDGTAYHGWQIQENGAGLATIQGEVEKAFARLLGRKIRVQGAGRTDAGVHAFGQCAHCDLEDDAWERVGDWRRVLNALLPPDIRITAAEEAASGFHARKSGIGKTYLYSFWLGEGFMPPQLRHYVWHCGYLETEAMREGARSLTGSHDFASFQNAGTAVRDTTRTIFAIDFQRAPDWPPYGGNALRMSVSGNGFLKQMVRNMAGLLAMVGKGRIEADKIPDILAAADRRALPSPTAPAAGLALLEVKYPEIHVFQHSGRAEFAEF